MELFIVLAFLVLKNLTRVRCDLDAASCSQTVMMYTKCVNIFNLFIFCPGLSLADKASTSCLPLPLNGATVALLHQIQRSFVPNLPELRI